MGETQKKPKTVSPDLQNEMEPPLLAQSYKSHKVKNTRASINLVLLARARYENRLIDTCNWAMQVTNSRLTEPMLEGTLLIFVCKLPLYLKYEVRERKKATMRVRTEASRSS